MGRNQVVSHGHCVGDPDRFRWNLSEKGYFVLEQFVLGAAFAAAAAAGPDEGVLTHHEPVKPVAVVQHESTESFEPFH